MEESIKIKKAVESDAPIIERIVKTAFEEYAKSLPSSPEALTETIDDIEDDIRTKMVFVAEVNKNTVGTVRLTPNGKDMYLSRFAVRPSAQNLGLGRYILDYADIISRISGCESIYLHTSASSENLMKLYTSVGYEVCEVTTDRGYERAKLIKKL